MAFLSLDYPIGPLPPTTLEAGISNRSRGLLVFLKHLLMAVLPTTLEAGASNRNNTVQKQRNNHKIERAAA
jgi:hypothetical protein